MTYKVALPYADPHMQQLAEWVAVMLDAAKETAKLIGCSPAAIVAQAVGEAGWLAKSAIGNNLFGIKADSSWHGARQLRRTWEHEGGIDVPQDAWFRDYSTLADGIMDHFLFLKNNTRYANAFDFNDSKNDQEYFHDLQADGYATAPNYADTLCDILEDVEGIATHLSEDGAPPLPPKPRLLMVGINGDDVKLLQDALRTMGFYHAKVDGDYGPLTKDAVKLFQARKGLNPVDGIVGKDTHAALGV